MNHHDQNEMDWRKSLRLRLDQIQKSVGQQWTLLRSKVSETKDRMTESWTGKSDVKPNKSAIKPKRVNTSNIDRSSDGLSETETKPIVQHVDHTFPSDSPLSKKTQSRRHQIDEAPDRTFVLKNTPERPDLKHVTLGEPELIEDTAVLPVIDDLLPTPQYETNDLSDGKVQSADPFIAIQILPPKSLSQSPISTMVRATPQTVEEPAPSLLSKWLPGVHQFMLGYQKRRKIDRSIRRNSRERVYRLKGYTTIAKVNRKRQSENRQRLLRKLLIGIIAILTLVLLFQIYNPIKDMTEWYRVLGIDSIDELTAGSTSNSSSFQTVITAPTTAGVQNATTQKTTSPAVTQTTTTKTATTPTTTRNR